MQHMRLNTSADLPSASLEGDEWGGGLIQNLIFMKGITLNWGPLSGHGGGKHD